MEDREGREKHEADERDEFLSAYSDDLIYLDQALDALLLHPSVGIVPQLAVASIARQTAITISNIIDMTLVMVAENERIGRSSIALRKYLKRATKQNLDDAVDALALPGHEPDREQLREVYLLRQFRNALVHTSWNDPAGAQRGERRTELSSSFLTTNSPRWPLDLGFLTVAHTQYMRRILAYVQGLLLSIHEDRPIVLTAPFSARRFLALFDGSEGLVEAQIKGHRLIHERLDVTREATFVEQQRNPNFQPTLDVATIRNLYLRNVERFLANVQAAYKPPQTPVSEWPRSRVDKNEWLAFEASLEATGISNAGARAYETMIRKAVIDGGGGLQSSHAVHARSFADAAGSVYEWLVRHVQVDFVPRQIDLDRFQGWEAVQLLAIARMAPGDNEVSAIFEGIDLAALTELPDLLGAGVIAQFVLLDGPVVRQVLELPAADLPEWSLAVLRMEALGHFVDCGSTQLIENLVWLESTAAAFKLSDSPASPTFRTSVSLFDSNCGCGSLPQASGR